MNFGLTLPGDAKNPLEEDDSAAAIEDWVPVFKLDVGAPVQWDEVSQGAISTPGASCVTLRINAPLDGYKGAWTLTVSELVGFAPGGGTPRRLAGPWVFRFMLK